MSASSQLQSTSRLKRTVDESPFLQKFEGAPSTISSGDVTGKSQLNWRAYSIRLGLKQQSTAPVEEEEV
jgi:hypothetical protein